MLRESDQAEPRLVQFAGIRVWLRVEPIERTLRHGGFDALLLHDDSALSLSDPIGKDILRAAGPALEAECARIGPVSMGSVVATSAGALPLRFLLHAITSDPSSGRLPTERTVRHLARTALVRCEALGIKRLIVVSSGESGPGLTPSRVAQLFGFGLNEHLENPSLLEEVLLVLPDQQALAEFLAARIGDSDSITKAVFGPPVERVADQEFARSMKLETARTPAAQRWVIVRVTLAALILLGMALALWQAARFSPARATGSIASLIGTTLLALTLIALVAFAWLALKRGSRDRARRKLPPQVELSRPPGGLPEFDHVYKLDERLLEKSPGSTSSDLSTGPEAQVAAAGLMTDQAARPLLCRRYVLLEEIGRGGMGVVYLSWDLLLRRTVAIKTLREDHEAPRPMDVLRREAMVAIDLEHEGIVRLYHFDPGGEGWGPFLVMEYVPWSTGERWIADSGSFGLPPRAVRDVGLQLCRTLAYAHGRGILHLDIKPSNIFVDPAGERIKLADFGLARALGTLQLHCTGTPAYMAPEQKMPGAKLSASTDVYLLSATLWDLATGAPPTEHAALQGDLAPDRHPLLDVLATGLASDPGARPRTVDAFAERLQTAA